MRVALVALDEREQEGRVVAEALQRRIRDVEHRGLDVRLRTRVTVVISTVGLGEEPDLTDDVTGLGDEGEHEVGRADPTIDDHVERVRGITGVEQDIVLGEGLEVDVLGEGPALGRGEVAEQGVFAEEVADAFAFVIAVRDGGSRHGDGFLRVGFCRSLQTALAA